MKIITKIVFTRILISVWVILGAIPTGHADQKWRELNLVNGCRIFDSKGGPLRSLPGEFCQFYTNGDLLTSTPNVMKLIDKNSNVKWEMKGSFHHQINKSANEKEILVLDSFETKNKKGPKVRIDKFMILDLRGKILFEGNSKDLLTQVSVKQYTETELTHINSFYEIPKLKADRTLPEFLKAGNFILNTYRSGVFILSADLKKVVHHFILPSSRSHKIHDVQVLASGNILYFNNLAADSKDESPYSSIEEFDLIEKKIVFNFTSSPKEMFFSLFCGGVQQLDEEHILFSHVLTGTYVYSKISQSIVSNIFQTHFLDGRFIPSQQVKAMDLSLFLTHWK